MNPHDEDDELRSRLAARDPQATAPVTPLTHEHLERAMSDTTARRTPLLVAGVAAALALVGGGTWAALASSDDATPAPSARTVLALKDPGNGVSASCMMLTKELLGSQEIAFAGSVTSIDSGTATLDVTHWFTDGTADTVTVSHDTGMQMSESLVLEKGKSYLIATSGDTLNLCTGSGPETPELRELFDEAFA